MKLLDVIVKEYITVVKFLEQNEPIENDRIIIDRQTFKELLEKYQYIPFPQKTKIYKALNFLIHDKNNYTMPYKDIQQNKTVRKVIINYKTYTTIKYLFDTDIKL